MEIYTAAAFGFHHGPLIYQMDKGIRSSFIDSSWGKPVQFFSRRAACLQCNTLHRTRQDELAFKNVQDQISRDTIEFRI